MSNRPRIRAVCFDWGGTLMSEAGPEDIPMGLWPDVAVIPGAKECLTQLHALVPLAIATNATVSRRPMIERALGRVGLSSYFIHIFCFTELGYRKNQPEFWRVVASTLGVPLSSIAMVGDSLEHDVIRPATFGVQSVWFNEGGCKEMPSVDVPMVTNLEHFADWVKHSL